MAKIVKDPGKPRTSNLVYTKHYYIGSERISAKIGTSINLGLYPQQLAETAMPQISHPVVRDPSDQSVLDAGEIVADVYAKFNQPAPAINSTYEGNLNTITHENLGKINYFYFHPDHLGSSSYITNKAGIVSQHMEYLPFGETLVDEHLNSYNSPFKYNGKEFDAETGNYYYGARYYDPKWSIFISVDPLAEKFPNVSPYAYALNNPIVLVDPDGREPIPFYRRWFGASRQAWQWYSTGGVTYDNTTFNSAASYSTQHQRASAYQSVYQRNAYYGWVQGQSDAKGYGSKWFGAAELVTGLRAVGGTEIPDRGYFSSSKVDSFLQGGNKFLFSYNMKNAKDLLADGKLSGGFTDANGAKQSFEGLTGMALDNKMVEAEQSKVQEYINGYKGNNLDSIISGINDLMKSPVGAPDVKDVMEKSFNGGKSFDFKRYEDRVKLGQELIKKAHND